MIYSYLEIGLKPAVFGCLTNAIAPPPKGESGRELFKPSKDSAILLVCNEKKFFRLGVADFL